MPPTPFLAVAVGGGAVTNSFSLKEHLNHLWVWPWPERAPEPLGMRKNNLLTSKFAILNTWFAMSL